MQRETTETLVLEAEQAAAHRMSLRDLFERQYRIGYRAGREQATEDARGRADAAFAQGEAVGRVFVKRAQDRALGVGFMLGLVAGMVAVAAFVIGGSPA